MILAIVLSPFARFYREYFVAKEKERLEKVEKEEVSGESPWFALFIHHHLYLNSDNYALNCQ